MTSRMSRPPTMSSTTPRGLVLIAWIACLWACVGICSAENNEIPEKMVYERQLRVLEQHCAGIVDWSLPQFTSSMEVFPITTEKRLEAVTKFLQESDNSTRRLESASEWYESYRQYSPKSYMHDLQESEDGRRLEEKSNIWLTPLFPGYGTHYSYIYVGTPPQRQSVIIDTGSHLTAFPCTGCHQCGEHTDPYFAISASSTAVVPTCLHAQPCVVSQSYTEGSSWRGYKVNDRLWIGGINSTDLPRAASSSVNFTFACQTSETGLFRTQLADGIMGISDSIETVPHQLVAQGVSSTRTFGLCFRVGGGILTLGGVDQRVNSHRMVYAKMPTRADNWFGVRLLNIRLVPSSGSEGDKTPGIVMSEDKVASVLSRGAIVDSGTTDTYLPSGIAATFQQIFKSLSGIDYKSGTVMMTDEQLASLPSIVYTLGGVDGENDIEVIQSVSSYVDKVGEGRYAFRVYLTERSAAVLGANFMNGYNVAFDSENRRLGFARSTCNFAEFSYLMSSAPTTAPTTAPGQIPTKPSTDKNDDAAVVEDDVAIPNCTLDLHPFSQCTAKCDRDDAAYVSSGQQLYYNRCNPVEDLIVHQCSQNCSTSSPVLGPPQCPNTPWTECSRACLSTRKVVPITESLYNSNGQCNYVQQTVSCYSGLCPIQDGDYILYLDMRISQSPWEWSNLHTEYFTEALRRVLHLKTNSLELLNNAASGNSLTTKLHFQARIKFGNYKSKPAIHAAAEKIVATARDKNFADIILDALEDIGKEWESGSLSRFGWMVRNDVTLISAVAMPLAESRNPYMHGESDATGISSKTFTEWLIIGLALGCIVALVIALWAYLRLRSEYALLSKDKSTLAKSSRSLRKMWTRLTASMKPEDVDRLDGLSRAELEAELEMSSRGFLNAMDTDDQLDIEELN